MFAEMPLECNFIFHTSAGGIVALPVLICLAKLPAIPLYIHAG